ncbi:hypothetical protein [Streptomyces sp. NPDC049879]|uniref:hypothetical protein n=1 Tax=Streptomyces sp. NPDC049879 TaxID=3365598 RepID=UPI00378FDC03
MLLDTGQDRVGAAEPSAPVTSAPPPPATADQPGAVDQEQPEADDGDAGARVDWSGLTWDDWRGMLLPVSPVHGPTTVSEAAAAGFSHDLGGAVLAAAHWAARVSPQAGPEIYGPLVERMAGDTTTFRAQLDVDYEAARAASGLPANEPIRSHAELAGWAGPSDPAAAATEEVTVRLLSRGAGPDGGEVLVEVPVTLRWEAGDWTLVAPVGGQWAGRPVASADGFETFPGGA